MKISVRQALPAQAQVVADILTDAMRYKIEHGDEAWGTSESEAYTVEEVSEYIDTTYLVCLGDEVVGTVGLQWEDEPAWGQRRADAGYIHRLAVTSESHGRRIGLQIIGWAMREVKSHGREFLRLDCRVANDSLCAYYESVGFKRVGETGAKALFEREL